MKESGQIALSYLLSHGEALGVDPRRYAAACTCTCRPARYRRTGRRRE